MKLIALRLSGLRVSVLTVFCMVRFQNIHLASTAAAENDGIGCQKRPCLVRLPREGSEWTLFPVCTAKSSREQN